MITSKDKKSKPKLRQLVAHTKRAGVIKLGIPLETVYYTFSSNPLTFAGIVITKIEEINNLPKKSKKDLIL